MSETNIGIIGFSQALIFIVACFFYMLGGRNNKWLRRYLSSFLIFTSILMGSFLMHRFSYYLLLFYPFLVLQFSMGYGAGDDGKITWWEKICKRTMIVMVCLLAHSGLSLLYASPDLIPISILCGGITVFMGIMNPVYAPIEEFFICFLNNFTFLLYAYLK